MSIDKDKARLAAMATIEKQFGKGAISTVADYKAPDVEVIPTGSLGLDKLTGIGGYARGRIIEIYGPNASGKTTLTLHAIAETQKMGGKCAFVDAEFAFDPKYAQAIGVDLEKLDLNKPENGEQALEVVDILTRSEAYDLIVIDSVSALVPQAEIEGEMGASHVGLQARLMGQALRKLVGTVAKTGTTIIFLNQLRMKIGVMFGSPETTTGGHSLEYYAALRIDVRRIGSINKGTKEEPDIIGGRTRVKIIKNKLAGTSYSTCEFNMYSNNEFGAGISYAGEVFEAAVKLGIIEKSGAWYSYAGEKLGQGQDNCMLMLKNAPNLFDTINQAVRKEYFGKAAA